METMMGTTAAPPMAQINVRINRELKEAGDAVLSRLGISPSQIVRDLWAKLVEYQDSPQQVLEALQLDTHAAEDQAEIDRKLAIIERATTRFENYAQSMEDDPVRPEAIAEQAGVRGLRVRGGRLVVQSEREVGNGRGSGRHFS